MKKNYHKNCGNCINYFRIRHQRRGHHQIERRRDRVAWDFGGLCNLLDYRCRPSSGKKCRFWKGIKYDKFKERRLIKIKMKDEVNKRKTP